MFGILARHIAKRMEKHDAAANHDLNFVRTISVNYFFVNFESTLSLTHLFNPPVDLPSVYNALTTTFPFQHQFSLQYNALAPTFQTTFQHLVTFKVLPLNQFSQHYLLRGNTPSVQRANRQLNHSLTYQPIAELSVSRLIKH